MLQIFSNAFRATVNAVLALCTLGCPSQHIQPLIFNNITIMLPFETGSTCPQPSQPAYSSPASMLHTAELVSLSAARWCHAFALFSC